MKKALLILPILLLSAGCNTQPTSENSNKVPTQKQTSKVPETENNTVVINGLKLNLPASWSISTPKVIGNASLDQMVATINTGSDTNTEVEVNKLSKESIEGNKSVFVDNNVEFTTNSGAKVYKEGCGGGYCKAFNIQFNDKAAYTVMFSSDVKSSMTESDYLSIVKSASIQ